MKNYILLIIFSITALPTLAQNIEGTYSNKWVAATGEGVEYILTLEDNGQFIFNYRRLLLDTDDYVSEVSGTWELKGQMLVLKTQEGTDNEIASMLNDNRARYVSVSPRHPDFNLVKPSLKFYKSQLFYAHNMELKKAETTISASE